MVDSERTRREIHPRHRGLGRGIALGTLLALAATSASAQLEFRSIDGTGNNLGDYSMGAANTPLARMANTDYGDGLSSPAGDDRESARYISNTVVAQPGDLPNAGRATDWVWQWGQFLDHDIDLSEGADPVEPFDIEVPAFDPYFDPDGSGDDVIPLNRTVYSIDVAGVRQQTNQITAWIDASNVYGSDLVRAFALRALDGTGTLITSPGNLLPFNVDALPNAPTPFDPTMFLAGDVRANEQVGLTAVHTLFMREHNTIALALGAVYPGLGEGQRYQLARMIVGAEMQAITYREFLPALLGPDALPPYAGYDAGANARIMNEFSTASYRFGHSMLSSTLKRLDENGQVIPAGDLALADAFFTPQHIIDEGIDSLLRGLARQRAQEIDPFVVDDVRNFLFGQPGDGGFDLASLNIQRGRDHGLPSYNAARVALGLAPKASFSDVSSDPDIVARLAAAYATVDDVDMWVGGLAEDHVPGGLVGELVRTILIAQFTALRDGDRLWYEITMPTFLVDFVNSQRLSDIIRRNTDIGGELPNNVFRL